MFVFLLTAVIYLLFPSICSAQSSPRINEVAWMGTEESYVDEWIELANLSDQSVDLSDWQLVAEDGSPQIELSGSIPPEGYFLLERTDDDSVVGITADQIYNGTLRNGGENLYLKNTAGTVIDQVAAEDGWPAGDNASKATMQYCPTGWVTAQGTPKNDNYCPKPTAIPTRTPTSLPRPSFTPTPTCTSTPIPIPMVDPTGLPTPTPTGALAPTMLPETTSLYLNEVLPNPAEEKEKVELYNPGEKEVNLTGWLIDDIVDGGSTPVEFSAIIPPRDFFVLTITKYMFNNSGDTVRLLDSNNRLIDQTEYPAADSGYSWSRQGEKWCFSQSSLGRANEVCLVTPTPTVTIAPTDKPTTEPTLTPLPASSTVTPTREPNPFSSRQTAAVLGKQNITGLDSVYDLAYPPTAEKLNLIENEETIFPVDFWFFSGSFFVGLGFFRFLSAVI